MIIRLIASSDIHGYINPINYADNRKADIGFLKLLSSARKYKTNNTLTIDNGDILQGSPLMNYYYSHSQEKNPIVECLNNNYDYINIGNHDFGYGANNLLEYISSFNGKCLCGNVFYKEKRIGEEYVIHNFDDNNAVALIGCVTQYVEKFESKENLDGFKFIDCYEYVKQTIKKIKAKEKVKAIIVVYHGGFEADFNGNYLQNSNENEGYRMCKDLDFDIIISGHQHRSIADKCCNKIVSQSASNGKEFVVIDYDLDNKDGEVSLIKSDAEVDDIEIQKFENLERKTQEWLDQDITKIEDINLKITDELDARINKHLLVSFINQVQLSATNSDLSSTALFNHATGFNPNITMRDLISTYIFENTLVKVEISGKVLKQYLEKCAEYFDIEENKIVVAKKYLIPVERHFDYDMIDGIDYTINVNNKVGNRIVEIKYQNKDVLDDDKFTLTINNYRHGGAGGFEFLNKLPIIEVYDKDMVSLIYDYLKNNKKIIINHKQNIKVIK